MEYYHRDFVHRLNTIAIIIAPIRVISVLPDIFEENNFINKKKNDFCNDF